jgi:hypothetical protein
MSNVRNYTSQQLLDRVKSMPNFKGFPQSGVLDVWVRSNEDEYNKFDDKVYSFECFPAKEPVFKMVCSGTSNAGAVGLKEFAKYNGLGCAVLKSDWIVYNSHVYGLHKGKPAYRQAKGFPYFRDNNKNDKAEEIGKEYNDVIGANCHRAGAASTVIGGWSTACLVRNIEVDFLKWLSFMGKRSLSVVILNEF